jgi:excisionase family DNA binding protein
VLVIHWSGGRHSELRVKKNGTGRHGRCTSIEAIAVIRQMAEQFSNEQIAATLNRLGLRTGADNTWNEARVRSARECQQLPVFDPDHRRNDFVTLREAAQRLSVSLTMVRRMIAEKKLPASQVVACAPWQISAEALDSETVRIEVENIKNGVRAPRTQQVDRQQPLFS